MQGTIGPIERARVMDLQLLQDDKPLTPAHRVPSSAFRNLKDLFFLGLVVWFGKLLDKVLLSSIPFASGDAEGNSWHYPNLDPDARWIKPWNQ